MFDLSTDFDPVTPTGGLLLAEIGIDLDSGRETLADDLARRCSDRKVPGNGSWREAREGRAARGRRERFRSRPVREPIVINESLKETTMSFGLNRAEVIGRPGADVTVNHLVSGGRVANLSVATDESYIAKTGERVDRTEWHRVVTFQPGLVDMLTRNARKGRLVGVAGKMQTRRWRREGEDSDRFSTEILLVPGSRVQFLDRANGNGAAATQASVNGSAAAAGDAVAGMDDTSKVPF